jgi:hypothetical protein
MTDELNSPLDAHLASLATQIESAALTDLPAGLEARIFDATLPELQKAAVAQTAAPRLVLVGGQAERHHKRVGLSTPMRIAASVALLATAAATWLANKPATLAASSAQADDWAAMSTIFDDGSATQLDELAADTAGLDARMNLGDDVILEEGSM